MEKVKTIEDDFSADGVELTDEMAFNMAESILEDKTVWLKCKRSKRNEKESKVFVRQ